MLVSSRHTLYYGGTLNYITDHKQDYCYHLPSAFLQNRHRLDLPSLYCQLFVIVGEI